MFWIPCLHPKCVSARRRVKHGMANCVLKHPCRDKLTSLCYNQTMKESLLVLFDGNAIVHRAYHAFQTSNRPVVLTVPKTGEVVTAVFGFAQMLLKVINEQKATCYAVAFDTKAPTFRHKMDDTYKAQRPPTPPELIDQFGRVKQLVEAFHIPIYELDGY